MLLANKNKFKDSFFKILTGITLFLAFPSKALAQAPNSEIQAFTSETLSTVLIFASLAATAFLIKGGYEYITSAGKPDSLENAKKTIRNSLLGLALVIGSQVLSSLFFNAFTVPSNAGNINSIPLAPITPVKPAEGLTQVMIDAITGFLQNIVQSATKPLVDGIISFLTSTPSILSNSVIWNFWLIVLGITDALFALVIALLGLQIMSASTFGFEELEFKQILPRLGLAFLGANSSIFLVDWIVLSCNKLVQALLHATGGLTNAWVLNAIDPAKIINGQTVLITVIFMVMFIILAIVLLLFYITRLILISFGAAIAPLIFLLWAIPKTSDFAEISIRTYLVTVYTVFAHVLTIQLASSFFTLPEQVGNNPIIAILIGVGLLLTLLKTPGVLMQLMFYNTSRGIFKKVSGQVINIISTSTAQPVLETTGDVRRARRIIKA